MANGLGAIRRAVADLVKVHLVTVVAGLSVVVGATWARVEAVAAPPAPQPQREVRMDGFCLASPLAKRPCGGRAETSSSSGLRRGVKAPVPLPPRAGWMAEAPLVPVGLAAPPIWSGPGRLVPPGADEAIGAWVGASARPVTLAAWGGSVRPVPRGSRPEAEAVPVSVPVSGRAVVADQAPANHQSGPIYVQVGAYREAANADGAAALLSALGYGVGARGGAVRAIAAGPFASEAEAAAAAARLREAGFAGAYVAR